jgi:hypothetical protein
MLGQVGTSAFRTLESDMRTAVRTSLRRVNSGVVSKQIKQLASRSREAGVRLLAIAVP